MAREVGGKKITFCNECEYSKRWFGEIGFTTKPISCDHPEGTRERMGPWDPISRGCPFPEVIDVDYMRRMRVNAFKEVRE